MSRDGYTLIELLVAMMIMAILTALGTRVVAGKSAGYMAAMKSDLRNIASAQEAYFSVHLTYANTMADLNFQGTPKVKVRPLRAGETGWSARTEHELRDDFSCALYVGSGITPYNPAQQEGVIHCEPKLGGAGCS